MMTLAYLGAQPASRWAALSALALLSSVALLAGTLRWQSGHQALATAQASQLLAEQRANKSLTTSTSPNTTTDFVPTLPQQIEAPAVLDAVRLALSQQQLSLLGMQVQPTITTAEPGQLSRLEVVLRAQGEYGKAKQMLSDLSARFPDMTVPRLKLRSGVAGVPGVVDMEATLAFWAQPGTALGAVPTQGGSAQR
jgi:hypothetical protein